MFNICAKCSQYSDEKIIDPSGPYAICPYCYHPHPFRQLPLFVITGASGTGKSTTTRQLLHNPPGCVFLEVEMFWRPEFATPDDNFLTFRNLCLRVAKNIGQAGSPVVLCGTALPEQYETCPERRYFTDIHYLTLVCDDDQIIQRLQNRQRWKTQPSVPGLLDQMVALNQWFKARAAADPGMTVIDTTYISVEETSDQIRQWIRCRLP